MHTVETTKGTAYILRTCAADMTSHNGFVWPREGMIEAPDWRADGECGHGLHGFLWGDGDGALASWDESAVWIVAKIDEWIDLTGKVKFPRADVVFVGDRAGATAHIASVGASGAIVGGTATAGDGGTATAGYRGTATAGDRGTVQVRWYDSVAYRWRIATGYVGEDGIQNGVAYRVEAGTLVEAV